MEEELKALSEKNIPYERVSESLVIIRVESTHIYFLLPESYPESPLSVEVSTQKLSSKLLHKLNSSAGQVSSKLAPQPQILPCYEHLHKVLTENKLLFCFEEVIQAKKILGPEDKLLPQEKTGKVTLNLKEGPWEGKIRVQVPQNYPCSLVNWKLESSNLPKKVQELCKNKAQDLVNKCFVKEETIEARPVEMTRERIKHDLDFIKVKQDLAAQSQVKAARRQHVRLVKKEIAHEKELYAEHSEVSTEMNPSLLVLLKFWKQQVFSRLPYEKCLGCHELVLSSEDPEMIVCGHWYHMKCLQEYMRTPPFEKYCESCSTRVFHPAFPTDSKALARMAKAWSMEQARIREIEDVKEFLDL